MGPFVHVESVQALENLRSELGRFSVTASLALEMADSEARSTLEWIEERLHHWRTEKRRWSDTVAEASAALTHCLHSGYYDQEGRYYAPSCGSYEMALWEAKKRLDDVEEKLKAAELHARFLEEAVGDYRLEASRLGSLLLNDVPRAIAFLSQKLAVLSAFVGLRAPAGGGAPPRSARPASSATPIRGRGPVGSASSMARPVGSSGADDDAAELEAEALTSEDGAASAAGPAGTDPPSPADELSGPPRPDNPSEAAG